MACGRVLAGLSASQTALACHACKQTPCVCAPAPEPQYECVTEMVPCTVMKTKTRVDMVPVCTKTVMKTTMETVYDVQVHNICKPVFETVWETRCVTVCRPVCETVMECRQVKVCRPVTTTRQVTECCLQPYTELVTVPVKTKCSRCGHSQGGCTCQTVARTCYRKVPVVREVTETHMVAEVQSQMVPVVRQRMVPEQKIDKVPVTVRRMVPDVVAFKVPRLVVKCEPKTLVYKQAVLTCQQIPVTVYRPVVKMVPVVCPSPQVVPSSQGLESVSSDPKPTVPVPTLGKAEAGRAVQEPLVGLMDLRRQTDSSDPPERLRQMPEPRADRRSRRAVPAGWRHDRGWTGTA